MRINVDRLQWLLYALALLLSLPRILGGVLRVLLYSREPGSPWPGFGAFWILPEILDIIAGSLIALGLVNYIRGKNSGWMILFFGFLYLLSHFIRVTLQNPDYWPIYLYLVGGSTAMWLLIMSRKKFVVSKVGLAFAIILAMGLAYVDYNSNEIASYFGFILR